MNFHDTVFVDYSLPIPDYIPTVLKAFIAYEMFAGSFKTYDMYRALRYYEIDKDGFIYELDHFDFESNEMPEKYKMDFTKKVSIQTDVYTNEFEHEHDLPKAFKLEYDLFFDNGKITSTKLKMPTKEYVNGLQLYRSV